MGDPLRGTGRATGYSALCKDCRRKADRDPDFEYTSDWLDRVAERGGTTSDRCPACRRDHRRLIKALAVPYVDLDVVSPVADRENPRGPLGHLGPLPPAHQAWERTVDLAAFEFGLTDADAAGLLDDLRDKQVAVVVAGTGSGKSTFIPYRLLYPPPGTSLRLVERGPIVVTEPRIEATKNTARMVASVLCGTPCGPGAPVGYRTGEEPTGHWDESNGLIYVTDGTLLNWIKQGKLGDYGAILIDEAHEMNANMELILAMLAESLPRYPHLRVVIASATIDPAPFVTQFGGHGKVASLLVPDTSKAFGYGHPLWPGEPFDITSEVWAHPHWRGEWAGIGSLADETVRMAALRVPQGIDDPSNKAARDKVLQLVIEQVLRVADGTEIGEILAFLPGKVEIATVVAGLTEELGIEQVEVIAYHRESPDSVKARAMAPAGKRRRIIVATNIAETSLTIPGLRYVVDSGLIKQNQWDAQNLRNVVITMGHSKFGMQQRWGRVGRTAPGWVFPVYTREYFASQPDSTPPELSRVNLERTVLAAAASGYPDLEVLNFVSQDERMSGARAADFVAEKARAAANLVAMGAIRDGVLTPLGREIDAVGDDILAHTALGFADRTTCWVEVATFIALFGYRCPPDAGLLRHDSSWSPAQRLRAGRNHDALRLGCRDDLDLALRIWHAWESTPDPHAWCSDHWISADYLKKAQIRRDKLLTSLSQAVRRDVGRHRAVRADLADRARSALFCALPSLVITREANGSWLGGAGQRITPISTCLDQSANRLLAMLPGVVPQAPSTGLVIGPRSLPTAGTEWDIIAAIAALDAAGIATESDDLPSWLRLVTDAPIGAIVDVEAVATGASDIPLLWQGRAIISPPDPPPLEIDEDEAGDLDERAADVAPILDPDSEEYIDDAVPDDDLADPGPLVRRDPTGPTVERAGSSPPVIWEDGSTPEAGPAVVIRHVMRDTGAVAVVRPVAQAKSVRPPGAWDTRVFRVTDVVTLPAVDRDEDPLTVLEVVDMHGTDWVVPENEFRMDTSAGPARAAEPTSVPGDRVTLTFVTSHHGLTPSLRPALLEAVDAMKSVAARTAHGSNFRGYEATVVTTTRTAVVLELGPSTSGVAPPVRCAVRKDWFKRAAVSPQPGTSVVLRLHCHAFRQEPDQPTPPSTSVRLAVLPANPATPLPKGVSLDYEAGRLVASRPLRVSERTELLAVIPQDREWADAVHTLWLMSAACNVTGIGRGKHVEPLPRETSADASVEPLPEVPFDAIVVNLTPAHAVVEYPPAGRSVRVDRSRIGSGVLDPREYLALGDSVSVAPVDQTPEAGVHYTLLDFAVPPLLDQVVSRVGGRVLAGTVQNLGDKNLRVAIGTDLVGILPRRHLPTGMSDLAVGAHIDVRIASARFWMESARPELQISIRPASPNEPGPGGRGKSPLIPGTWPATIREVQEWRIQVAFQGGAHRWVTWRDLGADGLLFPARSLRAGRQVRVEVGAAYQDQRGFVRNPMRVTDIECPPVLAQARAEFVGTELRGALVTGVGASRIFVGVWPAGELNGSLPERGASRHFTSGDRIDVRVTGARIQGGKLLIDLVELNKTQAGTRPTPLE